MPTAPRVIAQDVLHRSAHGRHAAASEHPADLRRGRGEAARTTSSPSTSTARARWPPTASPDNLLRVDDVVEIIYKCAKALHYAHGRGVIHRDIKPSNIMLTTDNDVRIIDFGIALRRDSEISRIEGIAGSPSYMSPEQVQSPRITTAFRPVFARRRDVRAAHRFPPVPRRTTCRSCCTRSCTRRRRRSTRCRDDIPEVLEDVVDALHAEGRRHALLQRRGAGGGPDARLPGPAREVDSLDNQEHFDLLRSLASSTTSRMRRSGRCCGPATGTNTATARTSSGKARSTTASISSSRAPSRSRQRQESRRAVERPVLRRNELRARRQATGFYPGRRRRHDPAREFYPHGTGFLELPAAL